jgi:asparagine synthase (glutamine-hydrolysing)
MALSIGVVVNEVALAARKEGCNAIILGQLADELFGGYMKYLRAYEQKGYEESQSMMMHDIKTAYKANFQRDEAAASFFTELLLPYTSFDLVNYAITLHPSLKMNIEKNSRKIVLREAALRAGLPENIVFKPKKAMQYSSKIQKYIEKMRL